MVDKAITTAEINKAISRQGERSGVIKIGGLGGQDAVAVGLAKELELHVIGDAGDFLGALNLKAVITMEGNAGNYAGDNMAGGGIIINGDAGKGAGAYLHGGIMVIRGNAGHAAGIGKKEGTILINGNAGNDVGLLQSGGSIIVCGNAKNRIGHLMTGGEIFLGGKADSIGENLKILRPNEEDNNKLRIYFEHYGIEGDVSRFKKIVPRDADFFPTLPMKVKTRPARSFFDSISIPCASIYSPLPMDFDFDLDASSTSMTVGEGRVRKPLSSPLPLLIDLPLNGLVDPPLKGRMTELFQKEGIPYIRGLGKIHEGESESIRKGAKYLICWSPGREGISLDGLLNSSGVVVDMASGIGTHLGATYLAKDDIESMGAVGLDPKVRGPTPYRHLDMNSMKELKKHLLLIKEVTGYAIPVLIRMEAGHVMEDLRLALKAGADSVIIKTAEPRESNIGSDMRTSYPTLGIFPIIRRVKKELVSLADIPVGIEMEISKGTDLVIALALGADFIVLKTDHLFRCGKCNECEEGNICRALASCIPETDDREISMDEFSDRMESIRREALEVLVGLSMSSIKGISPDLLYTSEYSIAANCGIILAGYNRKLPMWSH